MPGAGSVWTHSLGWAPSNATLWVPLFSGLLSGEEKVTRSPAAMVTSASTK